MISTAAIVMVKWNPSAGCNYNASNVWLFVFTRNNSCNSTVVENWSNCKFYVTFEQSIANIQIYSNIRIFLAEYLIFEYEYKKIGKRIYSNIRSIKKSGHEYIRIFVNFLQIYSNIWIFC